MLHLDRPRWIVLRLLLVFLLLWCSLTTVVWAQDAESDGLDAAATEPFVPTRLSIDPNSIPSEKISQFIHACLQVVSLIDRREGELQGAETESESLRIQQEIEAEALSIIEAAGLTRQEYLQLLGLANANPEFGERIALQLQEAT